MEESFLLKLSLTVSLSGLAFMALLSTTLETPTTPLKSITPNSIGRAVKLCGHAYEIFTSKKGHTFFSLRDETGTIRAVRFNTTSAQISPGPLCLIGRIDVYKGELELIVSGVVDV